MVQVDELAVELKTEREQREVLEGKLAQVESTSVMRDVIPASNGVRHGASALSAPASEKGKQEEDRAAVRNDDGDMAALVTEGAKRCRGKREEAAAGQELCRDSQRGSPSGKNTSAAKGAEGASSHHCGRFEHTQGRDSDNQEGMGGAES